MRSPSSELQKRNNQITGNIGLYHVCLELSKRHWNVMPTARNARGVDVIAYDRTATSFVGIQVKSLSKKDAVPLGSSLDNIMGDFWIIVNNLAAAPSAYILTPTEVTARAIRNEKNGKPSYWLNARDYAVEQ